ncbi:MAG: FtsX-like permease family protein [Lysobacteraceae bacterium]
MEFRPILSTLLRHKTAAALIVLEIALSCAIICNALFLIGARVTRINEASGVAENEIVRVQITSIGTDDNADPQTQSDLRVLRGLAGVRSATVLNQIPFVNSSWNSSVNMKKDQHRPTLNATVYMAEDQFVETLGVRLLSGRDFTPDEFITYTELNKPDFKGGIGSAIITRSMADKLFPGENAVGKGFYSWGDDPIRIVGVVEHLVRPSDQGGPDEHEYSMVFPVKTSYNVGGNYLIRTDSNRRDEVLKSAVAALRANGPKRIVLDDNTKTMEALRLEYYQRQRSMVWLLASVIVALLVVTALGIVGLASFWVQQRNRQIGVRRALGATRGQILRYFQIENLLLTTIGIALGMLMAYAINQFLMTHYELARLPAMYLPIGAVALWVLGQIAVYGPAKRAAAVPPAVATRSV